MYRIGAYCFDFVPNIVYNCIIQLFSIVQYVQSLLQYYHCFVKYVQYQYNTYNL